MLVRVRLGRVACLGRLTAGLRINAELENRFTDFFVDKIVDSSPSASTESLLPVVSYSLSDFSLVTIKEIESIIKESNSKCCSLDPIPYSAAKGLPAVTSISDH